MNTKTSLKTVMSDKTLSNAAKVVFAYVYGGKSEGFGVDSFTVSELKGANVLVEGSSSLIDAVFELIRRDLLEVRIDK